MNFLKPHRRYNPLTGEWILVSPHRTKRPWQGQVEKLEEAKRLAYDPDCYLCSGNQRAGGKQNPQYEQTFVFTNDFSALLPTDTHQVSTSHDVSGLLKAEAVEGTCRVICFSPRHNLTLASMSVEAIRQVINTWADQMTELEKTYAYVQVFENKGAMMGCSNPHPHGQIWASDFLPNEILKEQKTQQRYFEEHQQALLFDYVQLEMKKQERIVCENDSFLVVVPFWAAWPYETLLLPKFLISHLPDLTDGQRDQLADILKQLLQKYDLLFQISFPYSMGWHTRPAHIGENEYWQLHAHFYPPLLRSASVRKFMVGYEMLAEPQRDITAESAADILRQLVVK